jgi:HK97 family phage major capsid protein
MTAKELREKRASDYAIMEDLQKRAASEGRLMSSDESAQWDAADGSFKSYTDQISRLERWNEINSETRGVSVIEDTLAALPTDKREIVKSPEYHSAFMKAIAKRELNNTERGLLREMRGTATITTAETGLAGGYVIPYQFSNELERTMAYYGPMLQVSRIITTPQAGTLYWPKVNDTGTSANWHTEGGTVTVQDMTFTRETFAAHVCNTLVKVSVEWANDEFGLLNSELPIMLGERLGRALNTAFTTGDGTGKPSGFRDVAPSGVESASTGAFTAANLVELVHSVDIAYRNSPSAAFMMHDQILSAVRKLNLDTNNTTLFQPSLREGTPDRLLGYNFFVNNDLPSAQAADAKIIYFGDWSKYIIRAVANNVLVPLRERFMDEMEIGFLMYARYDGKLLNTAAIKHLKNL